MSEYYIAPRVKALLDQARDFVQNKDWDRVYIIDGEEGSGKSLLGLQLGYYLDPNLNLDRVVFSPKDFATAIEKAEKNQCIIFDEAFNGLDSTGAMGKMNRMLVRKLMECRQKNLYIIIILPTIFLLQKYAALFRSKALFHVYATSEGVRGYYKVYDKLNKKILFIMGKKLYSYGVPKIKNSYVFRGKYPIDEEAYRKKKMDSLVEEKEEPKENIFMVRFGALCRILNDKYNITYVVLEKELTKWGRPYTASGISKIARKYGEKSEIVEPHYNNLD